MSGLRHLHLVPADVLPGLPHVRHGLGRGDRAGHHLQLHGLQRGQGAVGRAAPYVVAYVELDEGPRMMTNIVDADPDTVPIGDA